MNNILSSLLSSKHTSIAGLIVLATGLGEIWFPQYEQQFHKTREFVIAYGLLAAGDAIKKSGNGSNVWPKAPETKPEPPPTPTT